MARDRTLDRVGNRTPGTGGARPDRAAVRPADSPGGERGAKAGLFERFARCLAPVELEEEILGAMAERLPGRTALVALAGRAAEPSRVRDEDGCRPWRAGEPPPPLLAAPIVDRGETLGWIAWVDADGDEPLRAAALQALPEIAAAAAIPAANARRYAGALEDALRDSLTGIYNRRAFEDFLEREIEAARRYGRSLSLILADVDRFKAINDTWGHPTGDRALRRLALVLEDEARRSDIVARLGGDEFALIVPASGAENALRLGRRIVARLRRLEISPAGCGDLFAISASFGVADLQMAGGDAACLVELADRALRVAKRAGGSMVVTHEAPCEPAARENTG